MFLPLVARETESALERAKSIIKEDSVVAYNAVDDSKEELARAAAFNSKLVLNELMQSDSRLGEEMVLRYALSLLPAVSTVDDGVEEVRLLLGSRLVELERLAKAERQRLPEVSMSLVFQDGSWNITNGTVEEDVLVYPAEHRVVLTGSSVEGIHVLEHRKRGIAFDVIEGMKTSCWFVVDDCVKNGHWSCGEKCFPAHKEVVMRDSVLDVAVWEKRYGEKKSTKKEE